MNPSVDPPQPSPSKPNPQLDGGSRQPAAARGESEQATARGSASEERADASTVAEMLDALRSLEGYQSFMLIAQGATPLLEDSVSPLSEEAREQLLAQLQRYAHTLRLLSPSLSGLDQLSAPQEIAATYQGDTHLIRCLDLEREIYCILTLRDIWPSIDEAREQLQLHNSTLLRYALRAQTHA